MKRPHPSNFVASGVAPPLSMPAGTDGGSSLDPLDLPAFSERFASRVLRSETALTTEEVFAALDTDGDRVLNGQELPGFRELVPEPRWSEEDFLQRFGHHLHHSTHAQAFADLDLDNDRLLSHEVRLCLPAPLLQLAGRFAHDLTAARAPGEEKYQPSAAGAHGSSQG